MPAHQDWEAKHDDEMAGRRRHRQHRQPAPHAMPRAAVSHTDAAVVRPRTMSRRMKITPPPMKPIPDTSWAAIRDGSSTTRPGASVSLKPYFEISMNKAAATPTSV